MLKQKVLLLCGFFELCFGCQLPMQPVYNATSKRHISCNVWEPDCPTGSICQPAGVDWKRKLDIHPKYILFLCCSGEFLRVDSSPNQEGNFPDEANFVEPPFPTWSVPTNPMETTISETPPTTTTTTAAPTTTSTSTTTIESTTPKTTASTTKKPTTRATTTTTSRPVTTSTSTSTSTSTTTTTTPLTSLIPTLPTTNIFAIPTAASNLWEPIAEPPTAASDLWEPIAKPEPITFPSVPVSEEPFFYTTPRPVAESAYPTENPVVVEQHFYNTKQPTAEELFFQQTERPPTQKPTVDEIYFHQTDKPPLEVPTFYHTEKPITEEPPFYYTVKPLKPSSQPQPEYHFFIPQQNQDQEEPLFAYPTPPPTGADEAMQAVLPTPAQPTTAFPIDFFQQPLDSGNRPLFANMITPFTRPPLFPSSNLNEIRAPNLHPALFPVQTTVLVPGNGFRRNKPGAGVFVLVVGEYETPAERNANTFRYSGTVVLVQDSGLNILVDTGSANSKSKLLGALAKHGIKPSNIQVIIYTHPHPDHVGNDNLFPNAQKLFANFLYKNDELLRLAPLQEASTRVTTHVEIWQSPGHTFQHNSVIVRNVSNEETSHGAVAITGDLFLNEHDSANPSQWMDIAEDRQIQSEMRDIIICETDFLIPGHGLPFAVTKSMKDEAMCADRRRLSKQKNRTS